ncbi:MAG: hypothetical protein CMO69_03935 [Verrucomicrobiales bacterium]|nr:hypothetical protein [Verrucomicrobiales bacterium]
MKCLFLITNVFALLKCATLACPMHDAAAKGDIAGVKAELHNGVNINTKCAVTSGSPLIIAALNSHINMTKLLISNGANLEEKDKFGNTSLHYTAKNGCKEIVELLIYKNADVNFKNNAGETPLDIARNKETAAFLLKNNGKYGTFFGAVSGGNVDAVNTFLKDGTDVNTKIQHGWSPMHEAVMLGHMEVAKLLITKGADINAWDGYETPLDVSNTESKLADHLRKNGAKTGNELQDAGK